MTKSNKDLAAELRAAKRTIAELGAKLREAELKILTLHVDIGIADDNLGNALMQPVTKDAWE